MACYCFTLHFTTEFKTLLRLNFFQVLIGHFVFFYSELFITLGHFCIGYCLLLISKNFLFILDTNII